MCMMISGRVVEKLMACCEAEWYGLLEVNHKLLVLVWNDSVAIHEWVTKEFQGVLEQERWEYEVGAVYQGTAYGNME